MIGQDVNEPVSLLVLVDPNTGEVVNADGEECCPFCGHMKLGTWPVIDATTRNEADVFEMRVCMRCKGSWRMG